MPDEDELLDQLADLFDTKRDIDPLEQFRRIALVGARLRDCLREVDALGLLDAGIHLDMTLYAIEKVRDSKRSDFSSDGSRLH